MYIEKKLNGLGFIQLKICTFAALSFVNYRKKENKYITQPLNYSTNNEKELLSDIDAGGRFVHVFVHGGYL